MYTEISLFSSSSTPWDIMKLSAFILIFFLDHISFLQGFVCPYFSGCVSIARLDINISSQYDTCVLETSGYLETAFI